MSFSNPKKKKTSWIALAAAIGFLLFATCIAGRFASENTAARLLTTNGFTHVKLVNTDPYFVGFKGCGKGDLVIFKFKAINPIGKPVSVDVCQGWPIKGATIRSL